MTLVRSSLPVLDELGNPAVGRVLRVYRRDTGALLTSGVTSDGDPTTGDLAWSADNTNSGWVGYTLRTVTPPNTLPSVAVRVTISAAPGASAVVGAAYVGLKAAAGDVYDFSATPVQLTFSGATSVTVPAGQSLASDNATLAVPAGSALVVALYFSGTTSLASNNVVPSGWSFYYKDGGNDAATVNAAGYTLGVRAYGATKVTLVRETVEAGGYMVDCLGYSDVVNVLLLDDDASTSLPDLVLRTTPV